MRDESHQTPEASARSDIKPSADALEQLCVIDSLQVGPVRLERNKLTAPYRVAIGEASEAFDFEYSFDEDVFEPDDAGSQNLAAMMAAQVALNYGLFCKEIHFHGRFDKLDRRFLHDMAENTAREIYVMKFLQPNPFLTGKASNLPVVKKEHYLRAELHFTENADTEIKPWSVSRDRHAVLSSGGKDSLLSFGLLQEMGLETHALFVNESGRHWFTALNAFRHFKAAFPDTARVWTNSDRLFSWMLRKLPFVRQDFAKVRSDEYPIRLWTVAVFLFGVLPLVRKRGLGRLIIGDEYDTTVRLSYKGISHYNGLYDQSRHFDNALTRYFKSKGWGVSQFSIVRQMSELLIEKVLATRYPELQQQQLSCHAAHSEAGRIYPCGKCEKCRRIVGMLTAIECDPQNCGYRPQQIDACLRQLAAQGVHQESEGAEHLMWLLQQKNLLPAGKSKHKARPHKQVMQLRFDPRRSPMEGIPADLRQPLYRILLQYADGAACKNGRVWMAFEPLTDPSRLRPYPYEAASEPAGSISKRDHILGELTWPQAQQRFKEVDIALLPVGAVEQHGPHLPLDTDAYDAGYLADAVARACSKPRPLVLPLIPYGVSYHHDDFSGTISVTNETLSRFVYEVGLSAARHGITKLIIINGHGGNASTLQFAAQMINRDAHIFTCVDTGETSDTDIEKIAETPNDVHAGEIETSTSLALRPHLVDLKQAKKFVPHFSGRYLNFSSKRSVEWNARTEKISKTGVLGDPTKASVEKGEKIWEVMIKNLTEFVEQLKGMTLSEIYERRY